MTVRVLVVDDDAALRRLVSMMLEFKNMDVVGVAEDGADAVGLVAALCPDLVLMDYQMPGMDGITATSLIKQLPTPPIIVLYTADALDDIRPLALSAGADFVLSKSAGLTAVYQTLSDLAPRTTCRGAVAS